MKIGTHRKIAVTFVATVAALSILVGIVYTLRLPDIMLLRELFNIVAVDQHCVIEYDDLSFGDARLVFGTVQLDIASLDVLAKSVDGEVLPIREAKHRFPDVFQNAMAPKYWSPENAAELCVVVRPILTDSTASYLFIVDNQSYNPPRFTFQFIEVW